MEKSSKRGKIPQSDWPLIMARYDAGETLSSIARTYDCSPPAISYVVNRSRSRQPAAPAAATPGVSEPQLVKSAVTDSGNGTARPEAAGAIAAPPAAAVPAESGPRFEGPQAPAAVEHPEHDLRRQADGFGGDSAANFRAPQPSPNTVSAPHPPQASPTSTPINQNGDHRRTLHLSLGGGPHANGV